jgi:hypothetical protein
MSDTLMKWEVSPQCPGGRLVPLTTEETAQRNLDEAAAAATAALPPPTDPLVQVVNVVLGSPDFATAKTNLAEFIAERDKTPNA